MSKIITKTNCTFTCPFLTGKIIINMVSDKTQYMSDILTEKAGLQCAGMCTHPIKTAPANGAPVPCSKKFSKWITGKEAKIKINGSSVLNEYASVMCTECAVKIGASVMPGIVSSSKSLPLAVPFMISSAINIPDNEKHSSKSSASESITDCENKDNLSCSSSQSDKKNEEITDQEKKNLSEEQEKSETQKTDDIKSENNNKQIPDYEYVLCDYKNCTYADGCEYLKASHEIKKKSDIRKINTDKEAEFDRENIPLMKQNNIAWENQAHHLLSRKDVFEKSPEIVKLANFYGYNIDCSENAIYLPSNERNEDDEVKFKYRDRNYKDVTAYDVISITKMQWHVGPHKYKINLEEFNNMKPEIRSRIKCYSEVLTREFKNRIVNVYCNLNGKSCKYDNPAARIKSRKAANFTNAMNRLSASVESSLLKYKTEGDPQKCFPYFISVLTLKYAYSIPNSGKLIKIFRKNNSYDATLFRFTKYKKDENTIILNEKNSFTCTYPDYDSGSLIEFCENAKVFFIFDDECKFTLPFSAEIYYIQKAGEFYSIILNGKVIDTLNDSKSVERRLGFYACNSLINQSYDMPQAVIRERKRQCMS